MPLFTNINKDNWHHAYLIEGDRDLLLPEVFNFLNEVGFDTSNNPDFYKINEDTFKIENARQFKALLDAKSFSGDKKVFIVALNSILREAQNSLLKVFEEPLPDTHFFVIVPSKGILLPTLLSRFHTLDQDEICESRASADFAKRAEQFLNMPLSQKLDFIKELTKSNDDVDEVSADSPRTKAITFLNELEHALYQKQKVSRSTQPIYFDIFEHILKTREYLRQSGSAPKMLLESVALMLP